MVECISGNDKIKKVILEGEILRIGLIKMDILARTAILICLLYHFRSNVDSIKLAFILNDTGRVTNCPSGTAAYIQKPLALMQIQKDDNPLLKELKKTPFLFK